MSWCAHWHKSTPDRRCYRGWPHLLAIKRTFRWCCGHKDMFGKAMRRLWLVFLNKWLQIDDHPYPGRRKGNAWQVSFFLFFHRHQHCVGPSILHTVDGSTSPCSPSRRRSARLLSVSERCLQNIISSQWHQHHSYTVSACSIASVRLS